MTEFLNQWKKYLTWAAVYSCFVNIFQLTFPFYMFSIYRNIVVSYSWYSLYNITAAAFFAVLMLGLFFYLRSRLLVRAAMALNFKMRTPVFETMIKSCVVNPARAYRGGINDLAVLQNFCSSPGIYALFDAPWVPFYLALIYLFHPILGLIATIGALIMAGLSVLQEMLVKDSMKQANQYNTKNQRFVASFMRNAEVTNGMGMVQNITGRFLRKNRKVIQNQTRSSYHAGLIQALIKPLQTVIQIVIYGFGAYYALTQGFNVGLMVAGSIIMGRALGPLMQVMSSWRQASSAKDAYQRLKNISDMAERMNSGMPLPPPQGRLEVNGAVFGINNRLLLKGISFYLNPGEFLGIIGPSGAGKTTLCRLILGIWPALAGKVRLDGRDIFAWDKNEVGRYIGYLPQEVDLFPGSVAKNIARLGVIDPEKVERAVEESGCKQIIEKLPDGLETLLEGERGIKLSGGQKQRIGLARALYGEPRFLVLDEPTSSLDEAGETHILEALAAIKKQGQCTCIMVTHKPSLLQSMDKILVVRDGMAAAFGPKDQVFAKLAGQPAPASSPEQPGGLSMPGVS